MLPRSLPVGETTEIIVNVSDTDTPLEKLSFEWFAVSGTFSEPYLAETGYTCEEAGRHQLVLVAQDDTDCWRSFDVDIACF